MERFSCMVSELVYLAGLLGGETLLGVPDPFAGLRPDGTCTRPVASLALTVAPGGGRPVTWWYQAARRAGVGSDSAGHAARARLKGGEHQ